MADGKTSLGKAYVQIVPSADGISSNIKKVLDPAGESGGTSMGSKIASFAKKAIIAGAIGKVVKDSLLEGGNLQQSIGGVETLFKDHADKVKQYAAEAYRTVGVSANEYMENVTSFSASLLQSLEGDTSKAAEVANMAMVDMGDNANKMGSSMESIQNAYQGFAKQNYTLLDNLKLGYGGTKTEMERLLQDAQKLSGIEYDINNLSDVYEAIHVIQGELDITGTTAKEASETLLGSFGAMKASFTDLLGNIALGQNVEESLKHLGETANTFIFENLLPMMGNVVKAVPKLVVGFFTEFLPDLVKNGAEMVRNLISGVQESWPEFQEKLGELWEGVKTFFSENLPEWIEKGKDFIVNLATGFFENLPEFMGKVGDFLSEAISYISDNLPEWIKKGAEFVSNLVSGLLKKMPDFITKLGELMGKALTYIGEKLPEWIKKGGELVLSLIKGLIKNLPDLLKTIGTFIVKMIGKLIESLPKFLDAGIKFIGSLIEGIGSMVGELLKVAGKFALDALDAVKDAFLGIVDIGKNLVKGLWEGIKSVKDWILDKISGFVDGIMGGIKKFFGIHSPSKVMADEVGKYLPLGLAQGISDNLKPVSKAMDEMGELAIRDFDSDVEMTIGSSFKRNPINDNQDLMFENEDNDQPIVIYLSIGGQVFKAFVDRVSLEQNKQVELELAY